MAYFASLSQLIFVPSSLLISPTFGLYIILKIIAVTDIDIAIVSENMVS